MGLTKDQILGIKSKAPTPVETEHGTFHVAVMSGTDRDSFELGCFGDGGSKLNIRSKLLVRCLTDQAGKRLFTDFDAEHLGKIDSLVLDNVFDVAKRVNGIGPKEVDALKKS
jgi:hypothetical protein